jgi:amino acid adenylation domain-containing protein
MGFAGAEAVLLDDPAERARLEALPADDPGVPVDPENLAYVIYTSGSTGRPKGVQVTHANVLRLFTTTQDDFHFGPDDVWALFHSYAFDFSVWEMWGPLLYGGRLVVVPYPVSRSPWDLAALLVEQGVTVLNQTPSAFRSLVEMAARGDAALDGLKLRLVIFGGEALDVPSLAPWWQRFGDTAPQLVNMYGITETTVHVTYRPVSQADLNGDRSPIGPPLRDLSMYVLDGRMRPVPAGAPGELYVGGAGVARGYLGHPALTASRFVPDPYGPPGARLYRTGDKACVLASGDTAFRGRVDDQVKIRGFRIELGEVQSCLADHPDVDAAVVTVHEPTPGDRHLVAYVVPTDGAALQPQDVRAHAAARLPGYMVPSIVMLMPKLPLTASGKVDRRALPSPERPRSDGQDSYVAPRNAAEEALAALWADVLGTAVGVHDNFFGLGGDSIRAVRLIGVLRANGFGYSVPDLFRHQSIAELVAAAGTPGAGSAASASSAAGAGDAAGANGTAVVGSAPGDEADIAPFALLSAEDRARVPNGVEDAYPMAQVQVGMVYELLADPGTRPYHNITSYLVRDTGRFDASALIVAIDEAVAEHEILRTSFDLAGFSVPMQLVHARPTAEFGHEDLRQLPAAEQQARMDAFRELERGRTFDLAAAPLFRIHAHQSSDDRWYLSITEMHAILDGWSHNSLISELLARYREIRDGRPQTPAPARRARYADFVAAERRSMDGTADRAFWTSKLDSGARLTLPSPWADPDGPAEYRVAVPYRDLEASLRALAAAAGGSLKSVLLAAHVAVWRTVAGAPRFTSGLVCNGRTEVEGGDQVRGMFLNPVPFLAPALTGSWLDLVRDVFAEEVELWPHRRFPLPELQRLSGAGERLLEVAFNYLDFHVLDRVMVDTAGSTDVSPNEFPIAVSTQGGNLMITAQSARVGQAHAELLGVMYRRALELMVADPDGRAAVPLLPPDERARLLAAGRGPDAQPEPLTVHERVARYAAQAPGAVAVDGSAGQLTYAALDAQAAGWATNLTAVGVRPGDLVGLGLPRTADAVAALLGVLRAGAAYVPVDPQHPPARIASVLADAGVRAVIATPALAGHLDGIPVVTGPAEATAGALHQPDPEDLAYVVHTSGSTGRPKGVAARHGAFAERVRAMRDTLRLSEVDAVVLVVPMTTDVAQLAIFAALAGGGRLVLAADDMAQDPASLGALLGGSGATMMQASPTTWRLLVESGWRPPAGFRLLSGGEALTADLKARLCATGAEVWDNYGPSEVTVFCFGTRLSGPDAPHWVPAAGAANYLLGDDLEPVPDGVPGQLFVGGTGLARGYLGMPRTTADVFLPDPHSSTPGAWMYATGDIGRRLPGGRIEVLGRRDHQLKIRGFRIELGEIENVLVAHPGVRAAVVHPVPGPQLAAYVIVQDPAASIAELRQYAADMLPGYMVPTHFLLLDAFPRLPNGKVDRAALPLPDDTRPDLATAYAEPEGPVEQALAEVWTDVLGIARVGRDDDFYALGGHSLLTLRIIARLRRDHGVEVTFRDFLAQRTIRRLAAVAGDGKTARTRPPALLWLGEQGTRTPLYCLHPGGGSARWYLDLADRFAPDRPLAAFEWPGLHGDFGAAGSTADIATTYLKELRAAQPHGPYHLMGWCGSSGIAWEMARRLHAAGEPARLILLDPTVDTSKRDNSALLSNVDTFRRAEALFQQLREAPDGVDAPRLRAELVAVLGGVVDDGDVVFDDQDLDDTWAHRLRAWRELLEVRLHYRFPRYPGTVDLVLCEELASDRYEAILTQRFDDYLSQWDQLAGGLRIHQVPGDHRGALRPPHVSTLAATLATIIDRPEEASTA